MLVGVPDVTANYKAAQLVVLPLIQAKLSVIAFRVCLHLFVSAVHCQTLYIKMQIFFQKVISHDVFVMSFLLALLF